MSDSWLYSKFKANWLNSFPSADFIWYCVSNTVQYQLHFPSYPLVWANGTTCQCRHTQERAFPIQVKLIHHTPKSDCSVVECISVISKVFRISVQGVSRVSDTLLQKGWRYSLKTTIGTCVFLRLYLHTAILTVHLLH